MSARVFRVKMVVLVPMRSVCLTAVVSPGTPEVNVRLILMSVAWGHVKMVLLVLINSGSIRAFVHQAIQGSSKCFNKVKNNVLEVNVFIF